jgi:NDP-sugar pyrophosphorylase family protein
MTEEGYFSIIDVYLRLAKKHRIIAYNHDNTFWLDLGKKENLAIAESLNLET